MNIKTLLLASTILGTTLAVASPAMAQTSGDQSQQAQMDEMKREIKALLDERKETKAEINELKQQVQSLKTQPAPIAAVAAPPPAPVAVVTTPAPATVVATAIPAKPVAHVTETAAHRFALESADGQYSVGFIGVIQADVGDYVSFHPDSTVVGPQNLNSGFNARRARIGITGKAGGDWGYTFIYDGGNSADTTAKGIEYAQFAYNGFKGAAIELGYSSTFFTLDQATSANDLLFLERSTPTNIAINLNAGDFRANAGGRVFGDRYWAGAYVTGPASGDTHGVAERVGAYEQASYQVLQDPDYTLHLGVGFDQLFKAPNGGANTASAISLNDRPELSIDTTTFANTGTLGTVANPVTGGQVYALETAANYKNIFYQGEYYHYDIQRTGLADAEFDGGYAQVAYALTGEKHLYSPASGAYLRINPDHPFSLADGGWGAWEIAGRYSYIDLNSNFEGGLSSASQPAGIDGGAQTSYALALNWYPNSYLRLMLDWLHTDYAKANPTAVTGAKLGVPVGAEFNAIALRTQVSW